MYCMMKEINLSIYLSIYLSISGRSSMSKYPLGDICNHKRILSYISANNDYLKLYIIINLIISGFSDII